MVLARSWTGEPGPDYLSLTELEEINLLLQLWGKLLFIQKCQCAPAGDLSSLTSQSNYILIQKVIVLMRHMSARHVEGCGTSLRYQFDKKM